MNDHTTKTCIIVATALVVVFFVTTFATGSSSTTKQQGLEVDLRESGNKNRSHAGVEATRASHSAEEKTTLQESKKSESREAVQSVRGIKTTLSDSGIEMVYQTVEKARGKTSRAILFLAHGCSHSATDFFDKSDDCKECIGLPIERKIVSTALDKGLSVVAVTSQDRGSKCWNPQDDVARIKKAVESFRKTNNLEKIPLVALGASSGGAIVHALGISSEPPAAIAVQIMPVPPEHLTEKYPPAIFWHMPRDQRGAPVIAEDINALKSFKRPVKELKCEPKPIDEEFFSRMIPEVSKQTSSKIAEIFKKKNIIDDKHMLVEDPRRTDWRKELAELEDVASGKLPLKADASGISELMNVAWAQHEFCDEGLEEALSFMMSHALNCTGGSCSA
uniref:Uncharacterized protein n=1 Tax=Guillardia theta TaxID=55529 RepID=A0A7S4KYP8_GUITH